jgi:pimeloyl-ACP methyl ester carboxylesterase
VEVRMQSDVIEVAGCEIVVERLGKGAPVIVLHGEDGPRNAAPFLEKLAETFEVHVPRLVGWSPTKRPAHVRTVRDVALIAQEYIEQLNRPAAIVGLSFGGWVAAEVATNAPRLAPSLVLISPIGIKVGGREDRDFADLYIATAAERDAFYYAAGRVPKINPGSNIDIFLEKATADEAIARYCWQPYMHDPGLAPRLRRIRAATLLISGASDKFVLNADYYRKYASLIPGARHEVIADAGHRVEEEQPNSVAKHVAAAVGQAAQAQTAAA